MINDLADSIARLLEDHAYIKSLLILCLALIAAKVLDWMMWRVIRRITGSSSIDLVNQISEMMRRPLFWSVVLVGSLWALAPLGLSGWELSSAWSTMLTILVALWSIFFIRVARLALKALSDNQEGALMVQPQTLPLFENLAIMLVLSLTVYLVFRAWNIDMTAWMASAGIVGIVLGFAARDTLSNLFAGVFILADAPFRIGDYIVLDNGSRGEVTHIGIRSTRLRTRSDVEVTVPNSIMGASTVTNESGGRHEKTRVRVPVGVAYGSDIDRAREVLMSIGLSNTDVCEEPAPRVRFRLFGASSLDFELHCWIIRPQLRSQVVDALNTVIYKQFMGEGIEIPYPKQDVYVKQFPGSSSDG
ncbi:MAG: mechanosensitive ion channel family protein [Pseudomonadota bacterium]|nr:mechanosensitive ion channel family protein [Pseudomonadota bacterium]